MPQPLVLSLTVAVLICFEAGIAAVPQQPVPDPMATMNLRPAASAVAPASAGLPGCRYTDEATPLSSYDDWRLTLLDTIYTIPPSYAPSDLVSTGRAGLNGGFLVRSVALVDLTAMTKAATAAGAPLQVYSAYRSYRNQVTTFWKWVRVLGSKNALLSSARPGHSEHQLGLAIDFKARGGPAPWAYYNWATDTKAGRWMAAHAWQYGFIMSYPVGKTKKTCYGFEPWHYRYVGIEEAAAVHASGLTLREWLWPRQPQLIN
jgi:zinc D-Ala-D-Ala carboxypeptidase